MSAAKPKAYPVVPYGCLYIDASWEDVLASLSFLLEPAHHRCLLEYKLERLWNQKSTTPSPILPCLSVRTALDLFLAVSKYPPESEIIVSAINIPDMARIIRHYGIKVVSLDVDIETLKPKVEHLRSLITPRTVALLVAHIYGRWSDIDDLLTLAKAHSLTVLEDCAEAFCGLHHHGNSLADITFFSFGLIKTSTAFGGAIAVVRDHALLTKMRLRYHTYPVQSHRLYLSKVLKYSVVMTVLNSPCLVKNLTGVLRMMGVKHRELIIRLIRGFPSDLFDMIRMRPSVALLCMLYRRLKKFDSSAFNLGTVKGDFVTNRLPQQMQGVGLRAKERNYWLFPILVDDPDRVIKELNDRGVDAYRGATQLNLVESDLPLPKTFHLPKTLSGNHGSNGAPPSEKKRETTNVSKRNGMENLKRSGKCVDTKEALGSASRANHGEVENVREGDGSASTNRTKNSVLIKEASMLSNNVSSPSCDTSSGNLLPVARSTSSGGSHNDGRLVEHFTTKHLLQGPQSLARRNHITTHAQQSTHILACNYGHGVTGSKVLTPGHLGSVHSQQHLEPGVPPGGLHAMSRRYGKNRSPQWSGSPEHHGWSSTLSSSQLQQGCSTAKPTSKEKHQRDATQVPLTPCPSEPCTSSPVVSPSARYQSCSKPGQSTAGDSLDNEGFARTYPKDARYIIDHAVYLPVHKKVSFHYLEQICSVLEDVTSSLTKEGIPGRGTKGLAPKSRL